jgi:hypothetical protein
VGGAWVVLHRVGATAGPVDSTRSGADGRARLRVARREAGAVYFVSARFQGIGYFAEPIGADATDPQTVSLAVYDTSTAGPALHVGMRHLIVARPDAQGRRRLLDIIQVRNEGTTTRVGPDSTAPVWSMRLPPGIEAPEVGQGEVSPAAVTFGGDSVRVAAPFPPGPKQIVLGYALPRGRHLVVPVDQPTIRFEVLSEEPVRAGSGLVAMEPLQMEGRTFQRLGGDALRAGSEVEVRFGGSGLAGNTTALALGLAALVLAGGAVVAFRRRPAAPAAAPRSPDRDALLAQLVALDERYADHQDATPADEWAAYLARRGRLKTELARLVARG